VLISIEEKFKHPFFLARPLNIVVLHQIIHYLTHFRKFPEFHLTCDFLFYINIVGLIS